ncbi:MAG: DUF1553 domain-containing protein [Kiritimatiellae bacterium]|nr:DUF1553 domain-containing protein [Kiritimatiellia bacterium]
MRKFFGLTVLISWQVHAQQEGGETFFSNRPPLPETKIDQLVLSKLKRGGFQLQFCTDQVFLRRAYLDITGTLPTADEARRFLEDKSFNKRIKLIDTLLATDAYADYWTMKWCDVLRVKAEFPVNLWPNAAQAYYYWVRTSIRDNKRYDHFVREMLLANGSNFRVGAVNFYRAIQQRSPEGIAATVALTFMGARTDLWEPTQLQNMAVFFSEISYKPTSEWKEEVVFWDPNQIFHSITNPALQTAEYKKRGKALLPDGRSVKLPNGVDPRAVFADWLINEKNPWFATLYVNRAWGWLLGRGIIHEVDDIRRDNKPGNMELLKYLSADFIRSGYDMKHTLRSILISQSYHLSSIYEGAQEQELIPLFACYQVRRMDAEVLIDAINKVTGSTELYTSAIPEPFTFVPANQPAVALPDGSISSSFLELFGKPARATGMDNERVNRYSDTQKLHLLNSSHIRDKIEKGSNLTPIFGSKMKQPQMIDELYLTVLARYPTKDEVASINRYVTESKLSLRDVGIDVAWALINSDEFVHRH